METACLRIKFIPLLRKNTKNNSKCCLEIVPEVSCIQNLDKLTWKQETSFIEYTIPMTYKVILKKRQAREDASDDVVKTYHSCVDLLLKSSNSMLNLGSSDVSKIISDTFIFHKSLENCTSKEQLINALRVGLKHSDMIRNYPVSHKLTKTLLRPEVIEMKEANKNVKDDREEVKTDTPMKSENVIFDTSLDKITNTENVYPFGETVNTVNAITHTVPTKSSTKLECTRRLTLSPICSVSTQETPLVSKIVASKAITCKIFESQKDLVLLGSISSPSDLSHENQALSALSTTIDVSSQKSLKKLRFKCRIPPEIRVAEYLRFIENEILPLKMLLNDIICKCSALGITFGKKPSKQSVTCKSVSTHSGPETVKSEEIMKSNRVVYSIVFDE